MRCLHSNERYLYTTCWRLNMNIILSNKKLSRAIGLITIAARYLGSRFSVKKCRDGSRQSELVWLLILVRSLLAWSRLWSNHEMRRHRSWASLWRARIRQVQSMWKSSEARIITTNLLGHIPVDSYCMSAWPAVCAIDSTGTAVLMYCMQ